MSSLFQIDQGFVNGKLILEVLRIDAWLEWKFVRCLAMFKQVQNLEDYMQKMPQPAQYVC